MVAFTPYRCLTVKLLLQARGDADVASTSLTAPCWPCIRHHSARFLLQLMVRAVMSARESAAGQIRVGTAFRLEGVALCVAGVVSRMSLPRVKKVRPTIRVPQGHGVVRGVTGHCVGVTSAAGQAFHCHRGWVDMHIQLLPREVCTSPKTSSTKKNTTIRKHRQTNKKKETEL